MPWVLRGTHREPRKAVATNVLLACTTGGEGFMLLSYGIKCGSSILNLKPSRCGWNTTTLHFWRRINLSVCCLKKKFLDTGFWNEKGFWTSCLWGQHWNYTETPRTLNAYLCQVHPTSKISEVFLLRDSTWPRISVCTNETITIWMDIVAIPTLRGLNFNHQIFTCLVLQKDSLWRCEDTLPWMTRHCRTPCTSGCRGRRTALTREKYMLFFKCGGRLLTKVEAILKHYTSIL